MINSNVVTLIPLKGVPQSSVLGPYICNLVLDGLEEVVEKTKKDAIGYSRIQLLSKYNKFFKNIKEKQNLIWRHKTLEMEITYLRYGDVIILYGYKSRLRFEILRLKIKQFLKSRGLFIKKKTDHIYQFKFGCQFKFLAYRFIFLSHLNKKKMHKGRFTKKRFTFPNKVKCLYFRNRPKLLICIDSLAYNTFKLRLRNLFRKGYFNYNVADFIKLLNKQIVSFANYFSYSKQARLQLRKLDDIIFKWFWNWLKKKYKSKKKLNNFLFEKFKNVAIHTSSRSHVLQKLYKVKRKANQKLHEQIPDKHHLERNIYLNCFLWKKQKKLFELQNFDTKKALNKMTLKDLKVLLLYKQNNSI